MCEQRCSRCLVCHNSYLPLSFFLKNIYSNTFCLYSSHLCCFFFPLQCLLIFLHKCICKLKRRQRAAFWKHNFCLRAASPLFPSGFRSGWCHVCDAHILTRSYLSFSNYSQEKKSRSLFLFFFYSPKLLWAQLLSQPPCFQTFWVWRTSLFTGLLEKLFTSINKAYSSWFYLSPFYCFRLLFILADTSTGTFQRRESKVIYKCIWITSRNKSGDWLLIWSMTTFYWKKWDTQEEIQAGCNQPGRAHPEGDQLLCLGVLTSAQDVGRKASIPITLKSPLQRTRKPESLPASPLRP